MTSGSVRNLQDMLSGLAPELHARPYRFVSHARGDGVVASFEHTFAIVRESEGTTFVVASEEAERAGYDGPEFARITLQVQSDLEGVGLTATVATELAGENIACNVVAGFYHDHVFVPWEHRELALAILQQLSDDARRTDS